MWTHYWKRWNFVPGPSHRLCFAHFSKDSFTQDPLRMAELGVHGKFQARLSQTPFHRCHWQSAERWTMADPFNFRCQEELSKNVGKLRLVNLYIYYCRSQCNLYLYMCNQLVIILTVYICIFPIAAWLYRHFDVCKQSRTVTTVESKLIKYCSE